MMGYRMKRNQLVTTKSTSLILGKSKSLMGITKKILEAKSKELTAHEGITIIGDLMWEKESRQMNWDDAMEYAKNLRLGGYDDWRLPTIEELRDVAKLCLEKSLLVNDSNREKTIDKYVASKAYQSNCKAKGFISAHYWSSTWEDGGYRYSCRCAIYFGAENRHNYYFSDYYGVSNTKLYVRCVRGEKTSKITVVNPPVIKNYDVEVYEALKVVRAKVALERGIPAYIVCSDKTLKDMAYIIPQNKEEMLQVHGIGEVKFEKYGDVFLEVLRQYNLSHRISINEKTLTDDNK